MMKRLLLGSALCVALSSGARAQTAEVVSACNAVTIPAGAPWRLYQDIHGNLCTPPASGTGAATSANQGTPYPPGATPITASATGTTAATTATLAANATKSTYICGFSIRANATAAATNNSTVTGTVTGTLNFTQWTAPLATGLGITEMIFSPCVISSAVNTGIAVISAAPGSGGVVSVTAWGFQL